MNDLPETPPPVLMKDGIRSHQRSPEELKKLRREYLEGVKWEGSNR
jgi:hypothetical protein